MDHAIHIEVSTKYLGKQDQATHNNMYVFSYTVNITNNSTSSVKLLSRYWLITNGDGEKVEVQGDGVIGEQPIIKPTETYSYTSASMLKTQVGTMQGYYSFIKPTEHSNDTDGSFKASIPTFTLAIPNSVH